MPATIPFDTHAFIKELRSAGFMEELRGGRHRAPWYCGLKLRVLRP
ncbi:MAG: hypothetical protein IT369_23545 [Candidatus Latescibacteria bacterium]|nr:hypothetical protein [Candidatus Latescibacterota bacterium]